ncbi:hypothetical protein LI328DRAFT_138380 [Trichoderma asperelloides]|nr:hypothetical protein LI328DRAFT_138380 [Trichoderma asperelloides]
MEATLPAIAPIESGNEDSIMRDSSVATNIQLSPGISPSMENPCPSASIPRPSYTPQFSSASWILDRIKSTQGRPSSNLSPIINNASHTTDGEKSEMDEKPDSSMSDTLPMPISPTHQPFNSVENIMAANSRLIGLKRKREQQGETDDFTQNTMSLPMPAPQPAEVLSTTATLSITPQSSYMMCSKCHQDSLESHNPLIPCDNCSQLWHQSCVPPSTIKEEEAQQPLRFTCPSCLGVNERDAMDHTIEGSQHQNELERRRSRNLAALNGDAVPAKAEHVGFWAGQASDTALTEYFYGKKKTDLLNILSFCDQLKPQLLVDIMVSVAKKHPDLPIFDSPNWNAETFSTVTAHRIKHSHQSARSATRPRHGHTILESRTKNKHKISKKMVKIAPVIQAEESPVMDDGDSLPPMWPKTGEGLYAKLSPEDEDRAFLLDDNDEEAFSHFGVDKFGKQIAIPVSA